MPIEKQSHRSAGESGQQLVVPPTPGQTAKANASNRRCIEVAAGLVFRDGRLLITQRRAEDYLGGLWEFPGGKRQPEESFEQCLARELNEELGVSVSVGELFEDLTHEYAYLTVHLKFFICRLHTGEPQPLGCAALKWVHATELAEHAFPAADTRLLQRLQTSPHLWR